LEKGSPIEAAVKFISIHFPHCQAALLAGSVVRGEATETSDLDIIVFIKDLQSSYRESVFELGWEIEVFVHNFNSYKGFFRSDYERARPSIQRMVSEGVILKEDETGFLHHIKKEAVEILANGPEEWSGKTIEIKRYFITDALTDFIGCTNREEEIFIANTLAESLSEFVLRTNRQWIGTSKWVIRSLRQYDEKFADNFVSAFDAFYKKGEKSAIIELGDQVLRPYGGRLFTGFSIGKN
jgi:predicted nucleotidyltransferase